MARLVVDQLQPATSVKNVIAGNFTTSALVESSYARHAESNPPRQLIVNRGDHLQLWESADGTLEPTQSFQLLEVVEHLEAVPAALGLFGPGGRDGVLAFLADGLCILFELQQQSCGGGEARPSTSPAPAGGRATLREVAWLTLPLPYMREALLPKRLEGICSTGLLPVPPSRAAGACALAVVAAHTGALHVITLSRGPAEPGQQDPGQPLIMCTAVLTSDTPLHGLPPGSDPLLAAQYTTHVRDMAFLPPPPNDPTAMPLLAVLHHMEGFGGSTSLCLDSLALELRLAREGPPGADALQAPPFPQATVATGPWAARNLHPTTSLIVRFPGNAPAGLPAGVLAVSSRSATLYGSPPGLASMVASGMGAGGSGAGPSGPAGGQRPGGSQGAAPCGSGAGSWQQLEPVEQAAVAAADAGVRRLEVVQYGMAGLPTCAEELGPGVFVIGDSAAGLHLLHASGARPWCQRVEAGGAGLGLPLPRAALAVPSVLRYLPPLAANPGGAMDAAHGSAPEGLLFVGSSCSNCQVLAVASSSCAPGAAPPVSPPRWPLAELAAIKSLAPVMDVAVVPCAEGSDDPWVVASCGTGAAGRLVRMRLAAGLQPYMADGPEVPEGCRMFAVVLGGETAAHSPQQPPQPLHTHVAFSFEAAGRTDLLCVSGGGAGAGEEGAGDSGGHFSHVEVAGLRHDAASLLVADVAGRRLVQVLQDGVRVLHPLPAAGLASEWKSPAPLSLAAHLPGGALLAVASRSTLHLLCADPSIGSLEQLSSLQLNAQLSALALCPHPNPRPGASAVASAVVLMGHWVTNTVVVAAASDLSRPLLELQLGKEGTPRSLALWPQPPAHAASLQQQQQQQQQPVSLLLAGTHTGRLLTWQLDTALAPGPWQADSCLGLTISQVAVELQVVPPWAEPTPVPTQPFPAGVTSAPPGAAPATSCGCVYLHSSSGAILRPRAGYERWFATQRGRQPRDLSQPSLSDALEVVRLHGTEGVSALCPLATAAMGRGSAAWVTAAGRLLFGRVDGKVRLQWSTAYVGETIHSLSYHAATRCLVALCAAGPGGGGGGGGPGAGGGHCLRVVHADSLQQVLSLRLAHGHCYTAGLVAALPCTSTDKLHAEQQQQYQQQASPQAQEGQPGSSAGAIGGSCSGAEGVKQKEFIVLASYLLVDAGADPRVAAIASGGQLQQGALSFMELVLNTEAPGGSSGSGTGSAVPKRSGALTANRYSLLLHGTCTIPAVANALAVARPSPHLIQDEQQQQAQQQEQKDTKQTNLSAADGKEGSEATGSAAAAPLWSASHLLAGCQDGVYLFSVYVDDGGSDGERAVNRALELVRQLDELALPLPQGAALEAAAEAAALLKGHAGGRQDAAAGSGAEAGTSGGDEDVGLAEDESELPDVPEGAAMEQDDMAQDREPEDQADGHEEDALRRALLHDGSSDEDEEEVDRMGQGQGGGGVMWVGGRRVHPQAAGGGRGAAAAAPEAARARRALRARMTRHAGHPATNGDNPNHDSDDSGEGPGGGGGASLRRLLKDVKRDWNSHVALRLLSRAQTYGRACVSSLSCSGGLVVAGDFLGSATVLQLLATRRGVVLAPTSVDRRPVFAQACLAVSPSHVLLAVHPHGLALAHRDAAAEERALVAAQRQAMAAVTGQGAGRADGSQAAAQAVMGVWGEAWQPGQPAGGLGAARSQGGAQGQGGPVVPQRLELDPLALLGLRMEQLPSLELAAACRIRHTVTRMCLVPPGLTLRPCHLDAQQPHGSVSYARGPSTGGGSRSDTSGTVLAFSSSGMVAAVHVLGPQPQQQQLPAASNASACGRLSGLQLAHLQQVVQELEPEEAAHLTGVVSGCCAHSGSWPLVVPRETALGSGLALGGAGGEDVEVDPEEEAEQLSRGSVDGALLGLLVGACEFREGRGSVVVDGLAKQVLGAGAGAAELAEQLRRQLRC